jgi:hypothetical protein
MTQIARNTSVYLAVTVATALFVGGCATSPAREGLDVAQLPVDVRDDYALFAHRCSKCHALGRALNSGIADDRMWVDYVNRMRRQPGSGISQQDMAPILRFLHYYTLEKQRRPRAGEPADRGSATPSIKAVERPRRDQPPNG